MEHLDYMQIHPTTLFPEVWKKIPDLNRCAEGALHDKNGQRFTNELQPRRYCQPGDFRTDGERWYGICPGDMRRWEKRPLESISRIFISIA